MSNYKGHIIGGCVAYGVTFGAVIISAGLFNNLSAFITGKQQSLLMHLPSVLTDVEHALHYYFPLVIGALYWVLARCIPLLLTAFEWLLFSLAGAMFPDIDIKSRSQKYLYVVLFIGILALIGKRKFYTVAFLSVLSMIPIFSNHRGLFHRLWFVIALPFSIWCWLSYGFPYASTILFYDMIFFIAGAISHLYLDMGMKMFKLRF